MSKLFNLGILIVLIILIISIYSKIGGQKVDISVTYDKYLCGYWVGDETFCKESDISSMMLFIGDKEDGKRKSYLIINNDITNQVIMIKEKGEKISKDSNGDNIVASMIYDCVINYTEEETMPNQMTIECNIMQGSLKLYSGGTIYGIFYKEHYVSGLFK